MKLINNKLFIEFAELVDCGVSANYLRKAKSTGTKCWTFMDDPDDKRKVLIDFESLKDEYKAKVNARFGNPYERMAKQPIRDLIKRDDKAEEFYLSHRYTGTDGQSKPLPIEHVQKYTTAASFLNMLKRMTEDRKAIKELLKTNIEQFWLNALQIIEADKIDLPTSYTRLVAAKDSALKKYIENGYTSLIDWRFGNTLAEKVKDELSKSTLLEMIGHPNQYDDVYVKIQYNRFAKKHGYKTITEKTVCNFRNDNAKDVTMFREGNAEFKDKFILQAKGKRPSTPLYMVESDDNHLDLFFIDPDDSTGSKHFHKYKAIVVVDSFNDYVLGYAYAENLSIDLVKCAWMNAMYYVRSLTGAWYLPHEVKTDNWAIESLRPYYKEIGKYMDTPVGSKNRGYIENKFGTPHWKRCLKIGANNYTGNNITAKNRGVNMEVLKQNKKDYPTIGKEAEHQIENFFHRLRHLPQSNGISKHDQWMQAWSNTQDQNKRLINDEQFLLKFGIRHNEARPIRITNRGVEPQIAGVRYSFDLNGSTMEHIGKAVNVVYDPFDMSRVLITDFESVRIIGKEARLNPRAMQDADTDSRTYLNAIFNEKKNNTSEVTARAEQRRNILKAHGVDAESLLQAGVMVKELKQSSEQRMLQQTVDGNYDPDDIYEQM
jgi:hypothetical protein